MDTGHGICGHKNSYSTRVKVGNYVEDRIGQDLAKKMASYPMANKSETRENYIDPAISADKNHDASVTDKEETHTLRSGLSYNMMFAHGPNGPIDAMTSDPRVQFTTTNNLLLKEKKSIRTTVFDHDAELLRAGKLEAIATKGRELQKKAAREKRQTASYVTTSKANSSCIAK